MRNKVGAAFRVGEGVIPRWYVPVIQDTVSLVLCKPCTTAELDEALLRAPADDEIARGELTGS